MQLTVLRQPRTTGPTVPPRTEIEVDVPRLVRDLMGLDAEVRFDTTTRALYATDASIFRQVPLGVVIPKTIDAAVSAVQACSAHGAPLVSRGGGTALCGQGCNAAVLIDFSKYLHQVLEIAPGRRVARVRPGTICDDLRKQAHRHGLTYAAAPATHAYCTFGGMIGNNSCGVHSVQAGRTSDNVEELEVLTYDGLRMNVGATPTRELDRILREPGRRGDIYRGMKNLIDRVGPLVRERYPKIPRRVSGYNLDELLPENGFHVGRAVTGSEGTLMLVLEAKLRLIHWYPKRTLMVLGFKDVYTAADHVPELMDCGPIGLEGIDERLLNDMRRKRLHLRDLNLLPEGKGWLLVEFGADTQEDADAQAERAAARARRFAEQPSIKIYDDEQEESNVWEIRESGLGATADVPGKPPTWDGWEDSAVHPADLGKYLRDFRKILDKHGYDAALYGHFGQGLVHCRIDFDLFTHEGLGTFRSFLDQASDLVVAYHGSYSGEHGDGQSKAEFLPKLFGPEIIDAFREFKLIWDPRWKMNPGKVVDPYTPTQNLRMGDHYEPWNPKTHFQFPDDDGSFTKATRRCAGVGLCRRTENAFMCPSYQVTREEKHTTRGRARALFEMTRSTYLTHGWKSESVKETLDLCLGCKGCKHECPVNVDIDTYKSEFLSHYYEGRRRPRSHYAMGLIDRWAGLGSKAPGLTNFFASAPGFAAVSKWLAGFAQGREIPRFANETFTHWYARHRPPTNGGARGKVVLLPDLFNNSFHAHRLRAACLALERLGYDVRLPDERVPDVRPLLHFGMLDRAKTHLREAINALGPYAEDGIDIVGLEPSTVSVFREEMHGLLPHDQDGKRISAHMKLWDEFLDEKQIELPAIHRRALLHVHCHHKAVLNSQAARNVLKRMKIDFEEPEPSCCGMAGAFGFEAEHYDVSMRVGEMHLLPAARNSDDDRLIIADGFSCSEQIRQGAGRKAQHLAEVVLMALEGVEANANRQHEG